MCMACEAKHREKQPSLPVFTGRKKMEDVTSRRVFLVKKSDRCVSLDRQPSLQSAFHLWSELHR